MHLWVSHSAFSRALQWLLFWPQSAYFLLMIPISLRPILILSYVRLGLPKGPFLLVIFISFTSNICLVLHVFALVSSAYVIIRSTVALYILDFVSFLIYLFLRTRSFIKSASLTVLEWGFLFLLPDFSNCLIKFIHLLVSIML